MNNQYPLWKYLLIGAVLLVGVVYALPNIFGDDPAVQITARSGTLESNAMANADEAIKSAGVTDFEGFDDNGKLLYRFANTDDQLKAQDALQNAMGRKHVVALNLAPATPAWLRSFAQPMFLGLDLRGGVHFLMQVDMDAALSQSLRGYVDAMRTFMREEKIRYSGVVAKDGEIRARFKAEAERDKALELLRGEYRDLEYGTDTDGKVFFVTAVMKEQAIADEKASALKQNIVTLRNRVNELGVAEPIIQQQGTDRIVVQLPGVQDTSKAKEILGATATLEYRLVHGNASAWYAAESDKRAPAGTKLYKMREDGSPVLLKKSVIVTGDQIKSASSGIDSQSGSPAVFVDLDSKGAKRMQRITQDNVGNLMAVVYIENRTFTKRVNGELVREKEHVEEVINAATIRDVLSHRFQTTGLEANEARTLSLLLRAGALKAPVEIIEERTVGPSLGRDNINQGFNSVLVGFALVLIFMGVYYKRFGLFANIALTMNLVLIIAALSMMQATLTLPGIAGIVLNVGMAVDANVLIFERIREELRNGLSIQAAIHSGYEKAFSTIADANITTFIAAVVLLSFGTGPIKGFAITLSIGIVTSMFTAIMGTRALVNWYYGGRKVSKLAI